MKILNYTPHVINFVRPDGTQIEIPSSGVARCEEFKIQVGTINDLPVYSIKYGNLSGLPEFEDGTVIVVSALAAQAAKEAHRTDCYIVADTIRNDKGQIIGARGLATL